MSSSRYAKIIIDISADAVDRAFTYRVPEELMDKISIGSRVSVPFGRSTKKGYVTELISRADFDEERIRDVGSLLPDAVDAREEILKIALFMAERYGSTFNAALKAALPVKRSIRKNSRQKDPARTLEELCGEDRLLPGEMNSEQKAAYEGILSETGRPCLLFGITGSGKTLVYIRLVEEMIRQGKGSIVLIPEISLTYQTVRLFSAYFSGRISVLHSRLSAGERYEQYMKVERGEVDVVIGPRSAVFAPLRNLGLIVVDEEHERAYRSDTSPRYDTREVACFRADMEGARVVLGSATPSIESYRKAQSGQYRLFELKNRAVSGARLPKIYISDMRRELSEGNRSIFSKELRELMEDRLEKKEQIMLFLNRRGYAGFVSCRSCGYVVKCPHCDVSMTAHNEWYYDRSGSRTDAARLRCHYCGHEAMMPRRCLSCGSPYIAAFGTGTQKLEQEVKRAFPKASVLRMDADTTARKGSHERILAAFSAHKADILIGTQMIVKGHDFPEVTLVGIVSADLSLNVPEYDAAERTFQLLTQASGRSGRGERSGAVVIQSYEPDHYAISTAAAGDYKGFYEREMSYRKLLSYPPFCRMLCIRLQSEDEELLERAARGAERYFASELSGGDNAMIGPCNASPYKLNDIYRKNLYIKQFGHAIIGHNMNEDAVSELIRIREALHELITEKYRGIQMSFELF